jgi:choline dehydrogenase
MDLMCRAVEIGRDVASQRIHQSLGLKAVEPGGHIRTRADMEDYVRGNVAGDFHLAGSCKMGSDSLSVVDSTLKLHGLEKLRVVDSSIMPSIVNANTNATTFMIAEKASDMMLGRPPLSA